MTLRDSKWEYTIRAYRPPNLGGGLLMETVHIGTASRDAARIWTADRRVLIRGSMNLNYNPRFEQADLTVDGDDFDLVTRIEDALPILPPLAPNADAEDATGLSRAFELSDVAAFAGVKPWAK